ncbi:MAG TPA: hypothetical protein VM013_04410 [Dehalococcoidia bacterium]|nr:hypothetical protein [Dehalococcoidia bacterium]
MREFQDTAGRIWRIALNLGTALAVKQKLGVDLLQPEQGDPPLLTRLGTDEMLLGEVLCALLGDQFDKNNVTDADVRAAFDGATLLLAQSAFYEELVDFFRQRGRADRARAVETQQKIILAAIDAATKRIDGLDLPSLIDGVMSGSSPDVSVSTLGV